MNKEIKKLLEKAKESNNHIFRALKIHAHVNISDVECTDSFVEQALELLKQQPTVGEFRERVKNRLPICLPGSYEGMKSLCATLTDTAKEACDIIDQKDKLLFAYESVRAPKQPTAGEFTKKARKYCNSVIEFAQTVKDTVNEETKEVITKKLFDLLFAGFDIIDSAEARLKVIPDLLAACERDALLADIAITETPTDDLRNKLTEINILRIAAIAKAKQ